jgi:ATP-dependent Clp protease ATP-binding subunit ClpA
MFERFTQEARSAMVGAQDEAKDLGHNYLGTEHLLLGVLGRSEAPGARLLRRWEITVEETRERVVVLIGRGDPRLDAEALASIGIDLDEVRRRIEAAFGEGALARRGGRRGFVPGPWLPFTPKAKKALELALREALSLGHPHVGSEHVVLGLLREGEGVAAKLLVERGARLDEARDMVTGRSAA